MTTDAPNIRPHFAPVRDLANLIDAMQTTDDAELIYEFMELMQSAEERLVDEMQQVCDVINSLKMTTAGIDAEIERLTQLKNERTVRAERLEAILKEWMEQVGKSALLLPRNTLKLPKPSVSVNVYDEAAIPAAYLRWTEPKPAESFADKNAIKEALKAGHEVAGCELKFKSKLVIA